MILICEVNVKRVSEWDTMDISKMRKMITVRDEWRRTEEKKMWREWRDERGRRLFQEFCY